MPIPPHPRSQAIAAFLKTLREHRSTVVLATAAVLTGFGITAVAVAPLVPGEEVPTVRQVVESIEPQGLDAQLQALANQQFTLSRGDLTRGTDSAYTLLNRMGVRDAAAVGFLVADTKSKALFSGRAGKMVQVRTNTDGSLLDLVARYPSDTAEQAKTHFQRLRIERVKGIWQSSLAIAPYAADLRMASGTIRSSLFAATDEAGLPDAVAAQLADIFSSDIDMHRQLRRGDTFRLVYETLVADEQPVAWNDGLGRVVAAEFVNAGKAHHAVWFAQDQEQGAYFGLNGLSKRNAFLASPMEFSRVTSGFAMRVHPIFQTTRQHLGVDYAAPMGTAVRSVGAGTVEVAGQQSGYGNVVEVKHDGAHSTLYAHLSSIDVKPGQRVEQGQRLGGVGATGWATGPHLHFEFRVGGVHKDPLQVAKVVETTALSTQARQRFSDLSRGLHARLTVAESLTGSRKSVE
jgi:murein DD-endopeptidase MepM/ murein hydrolase activator NlpD